jgi:hypothetical protein
MLLIASALAAAQEIGIDRSDLSTKSEQDRIRIITGIHDLGAQWFRDGYSSKAPKGVADLVDVVRIAKQQNFKVLINVLPVGDDYDPGAQPTNGGPGFAKRCGLTDPNGAILPDATEVVGNQRGEQLGPTP